MKRLMIGAAIAVVWLGFGYAVAGRAGQAEGTTAAPVAATETPAAAACPMSHGAAGGCSHEEAAAPDACCAKEAPAPSDKNDSGQH